MFFTSFRLFLPKRQVQEYWVIFFFLPTAFIFPFSKQCNMDQGLSSMEHKLMDIINIFNSYTVRKGTHQYLNRKELRELLEKEIPNFLSVSSFLKVDNMVCNNQRHRLISIISGSNSTLSLFCSYLGNDP